MRRAIALVLLSLAALAAPAAADEHAPATPDFVIDIDAGGNATIKAPPGLVSAGEVQRGQRYTWHLKIPSEYVVGEVRVHRAFDVTRPMQILPLWQNATGVRDDHFFGHVHRPHLEVHHLVNFTGSNGEYVIRVGFPGPNDRTFILERDVRPPKFQIGPVRNLTHNDFLLTTRTDEYAFADLQIRAVGSAEWIQNPTTVPALEQTFPVQGLKSGKVHEMRFRFWDWSGNEAWTEPTTLEVPPAPVPPKPVLRILEPAPDATIQTATPTLRVAVTTPESPIRAGGVRVWIDLTEVPGGGQLLDGNATHVPAPLSAGLHRVRFEVTNDLGGTGVATWTFKVAGGIPAAGLLLVAAGALLAAAVARR